MRAILMFTSTETVRTPMDGHLKKRKQSWSETLEAEAETYVFYSLLFQQLWASSK